MVEAQLDTAKEVGTTSLRKFEMLVQGPSDEFKSHELCLQTVQSPSEAAEEADAGTGHRGLEVPTITEVRETVEAPVITKVRKTVEVPAQSAQVPMAAKAPETVEVPQAELFRPGRSHVIQKQVQVPMIIKVRETVEVPVPRGVPR